MDLNKLLAQIKDLIYDDPSTPQTRDNDPSGLMGRLEGLFKGAQEEEPQFQGRDVRPASEDPLGDPADVYGGYQSPTSYPYVEGDVRPASEDPLGDPADQFRQVDRSDPRFKNLKPASEDPLGDPADNER
jgi:hypothetical protein